MTRPRLIFIAMPAPEVLSAMWMAVSRNGLDIRLGPALFPARNWHQTLSDRYEDEPGIRERMRRAGSRISASACTLTLNRIRDQASDGPRHWAFNAKGKSRGFAALLAAIRTALAEEYLDTESGHTPHVTISYGALDRLGPTTMNPIYWTINEILLVVGGGWPYSYEVIARWPLLPLAPNPTKKQLSLF